MIAYLGQRVFVFVIVPEGWNYMFRMSEDFSILIHQCILFATRLAPQIP